MKFVLILLLWLFLCANCWGSDIKVEGNYFVVENRGITIKYKQNECGYVLSKNVLQNVLDDAKAGEYSWSMMSSSNFQKWILNRECKRLKKVMEEYRRDNKKF